MSRAIVIATLLLIGSSATVQAADAVTADMCHAHRKQQLSDIERNRMSAAAHIQGQIDQATDDKAKAALTAEMEQVFDHEEQFRGITEMQFRDCMAFVKSKS